MMVDKERKSDAGQVDFGDLDRAIRDMTKTGLELGKSVSGVAEEVMETAVRLSERVRDNVLAEKSIERARQEGIVTPFREKAHRAVDVAADVVSVVAENLRDWADRPEDEEKSAPPGPAQKTKRG